MDHNKVWKILKEMGIPDHLTYLRNLYAGQEATARTVRTVRTWNNGLVPKWERRTSRLYTVTLLIKLIAEYIMRNVELEEAQTGINTVGRNINNLRYAHDTTLMAESEEELKSLLMKVKEESEKSWLKTQHSKKKIMASGPITSWQIDQETMETVTVEFYFLVFQNHCRW